MSDLRIMEDIDTTGNDPSTVDILNIGMLSCERQCDGFWHPGPSLNVLLHTSMDPPTPFAREHQVELYEMCKAVDPKPKEVVIKAIHEFFDVHSNGYGVGPHRFMGWNAAGFDMPILVRHGYLMQPVYRQTTDGKEVLVGDFHYRIMDIQSIYNFVRETFRGVPSDKEQFDNLLKDRERPIPTFAGENVRKHIALDDCYRQLDTLNRLIDLAQELK